MQVNVKVTSEKMTEAQAADLRKNARTLAERAFPITLIKPMGDPVPAAADASAWGLAATMTDKSKFDGTGATVAVLDTGIDPTHPAFAHLGERLVRKDFTKAFTTDAEEAMDFEGHGTHCAGTIFGGTVGNTRIGTAPNGSSIAVIAEYAGKRVLLGADAHPDALVASLSALKGSGTTVPLDLVKLPHHASRANVTRELVELLDCRRFAISTSGAVFGHPDPEAIARVLKFGQPGAKTLLFNYASDRSKPWDDAALQAKWDYSCVFPAADAPLTIEI